METASSEEEGGLSFLTPLEIVHDLLQEIVDASVLLSLALTNLAAPGGTVILAEGWTEHFTTMGHGKHWADLKANTVTHEFPSQTLVSFGEKIVHLGDTAGDGWGFTNLIDSRGVLLVTGLECS